MMIFISLLCSLWFSYEIKNFPHKINLRIYEDIEHLLPNNIEKHTLLKCSRLQPISENLPFSYWLLFPFSAIVASPLSIPLQLILFVLLYLAYLDYYYYLTDIRYVIFIALLQLTTLLFEQNVMLYFHLLSFLGTTLFFISFVTISRLFFHKDMLGSGDVFLFSALSLLFTVEEMLYLISISCLLGMSFSFYFFCKFKRKIDRLPFIPFITISTFLCFIVKLPAK